MDGLISNLNCMCCDTNMNIELEGAHTTPPEILVELSLIHWGESLGWIPRMVVVLLRGRILYGCVGMYSPSWKDP